MNGTCQNKGCENPATTALTFGGRDYRICSKCRQELQPQIVATAEAARKAADQISGYLAGHFGTSIAQAAPLAQMLVGQVVSGPCPGKDHCQGWRLRYRGTVNQVARS